MDKLGIIHKHGGYIRKAKADAIKQNEGTRYETMGKLFETRDAALEQVDKFQRFNTGTLTTYNTQLSTPDDLRQMANENRSTQGKILAGGAVLGAGSALLAPVIGGGLALAGVAGGIALAGYAALKLGANLLGMTAAQKRADENQTMLLQTKTVEMLERADDGFQPTGEVPQQQHWKLVLTPSENSPGAFGVKDVKDSDWYWSGKTESWQVGASASRNETKPKPYKAKSRRRTRSSSGSSSKSTYKPQFKVEAGGTITTAGDGLYWRSTGGGEIGFRSGQMEWSFSEGPRNTFLFPRR